MSMETVFYKAKYLIVWDEGQHKVLYDGYLGVKGDTVEGVYRTLPEGASCEDLGEAVLFPGFVNLHTHPSELFSIKSFVEDNANPNFYESSLIDKPIPHMGRRGAELQTLINLAELIKSGVTSALIYGGPYSRLEADTAGKLGMRAWVGAGIRAGDAMEDTWIWHSPDGHSVEYTFDEEAGKERLKEAEVLFKDYDGAYDGRIHIMMGPTQTMTCTPWMLEETRRLADKLGCGITIHACEDMTEYESAVRLRGKTPVRLMADTGILGEDCVIAHCVYINGHSRAWMQYDDDLELLARSKSTVAHSPTPFARVGERLESYTKYKNAGINLAFGTDTFPSDFIQEMRLAAFMGKMTEHTSTALNAGDIFNTATIGGAKGLGRKDLGRLEKGAKADFVVVGLDNIEMTPARDVVKTLVYTATRHSVQDVYVAGKKIVSKGMVEGFDERAACAELRQIAHDAYADVRDVQGHGMDEVYKMTFPKY
ncbi:amidohydrolase family protein [Ruminococcaceae bacterium OttesenSCG-928-D13]|nr:amidohydrolase family protein [Ruminococcaceae bacterium OttesenSCG-928-D13]